MNTAATIPAPTGWNARLPWVVAAVGLAVLYVPTLIDLPSASQRRLLGALAINVVPLPLNGSNTTSST